MRNMNHDVTGKIALEVYNEIKQSSKLKILDRDLEEYEEVAYGQEESKFEEPIDLRNQNLLQNN